MKEFLYVAIYIMVVYAIATYCRRKNGEGDYVGIDMIAQDHVVIIKYVFKLIESKLK